jgi:predicted SAM-dependent methyltransferase
VKLQVGSSEVRGIYKRAEWINLDLQDVSNDGVNVIGSGLELPFADNSFDEVHCIHVLEHLTRDKPPVMMDEMYRVLASGGVLYVEVPDFKGTVAKLAAAFMEADEHEIHKWTTSVYGKSERYGMAHHCGFYQHTLFVLFRMTGLSGVLRLTADEHMISPHFRQEPVLLMRGFKNE